MNGCACVCESMHTHADTERDWWGVAEEALLLVDALHFLIKQIRNSCE